MTRVQRAETPQTIPAAELELWGARHAEGNARKTLFMIHLPIARQIAWRMRRNGGNFIEFEELLQLGSVGLLEAIDRFDPALGVPFRFYGSRRITGHILNGIARHSEVDQQLSYQKRIARERLASIKSSGKGPMDLTGRLKAIAEIAGSLALGLILEDAGLAVTPNSEAPDNAYQSLAWRQLVGQAKLNLDLLPERERQVLSLHYLEGIAFDQIAALMKLSKGRISQVHKSGLALLRKRLANSGHFRVEG